MTAIALGRKSNLNEKLIKQFTPEEMKEYRRKRYEKEKEKRLEYQKEYYQKHISEIKKKSRNRYRIKCGLEIKG